MTTTKKAQTGRNKKGSSKSKQLSLLFIGNSFTARNDVPALVEQLAAVRDCVVTHKLISAGGASLRMHWNKGSAKSEIESGGYDYVILQEQSTLPVKNAKRMHENIRLFDEVIVESGSLTMLYMTWARRHEPQNQNVINSAYRAIAEEIGASVVPAGEAWQLASRDHPEINLYDSDNSHPSFSGSFLAACTFYCTLFGEPADPKIEIEGLSEVQAVTLKKCAAKAAGV